MLKKPLLVAVLAATAATATVSTTASADPVLGALLGAGIGAAVGHNIHGREGAWVGGALGAVTGASIGGAGYYDRGYVGQTYAYNTPAPVYYAPETMPGVLRPLAQLLPTACAARAVQTTLAGGFAIGNELIALGLMAAVTLSLGFKLMRWREE